MEVEDKVEVETAEAIIPDDNDASVQQTSDPPHPESMPTTAAHNKRRLRRNCSDWDRTLNLKVRQNANRDHVITVTKSILAYIVDDINKDGDTITGIIEECARLERE